MIMESVTFSLGPFSKRTRKPKPIDLVCIELSVVGSERVSNVERLKGSLVRRGLVLVFLGCLGTSQSYLREACSRQDGEPFNESRLA